MFSDNDYEWNELLQKADMKLVNDNICARNSSLMFCAETVCMYINCNNSVIINCFNIN